MGALSSFLSLASSSVIAIFVLSLISTSSSLSVSELHGKYYEIFHRSGNRNAASHLWASYILDRTTLDVLVIGDPCVQPERIPRRAPEVRCVGGRLEGATRSAHDHVVIGVMQTGERGQTTYYKAEMVDSRCRARKQAGYRSGMGRIFVEVASINPIS